MLKSATATNAITTVASPIQSARTTGEGLLSRSTFTASLLVEIFIGIITRQAIRRGTFRSVKELTAAIGRFIDAYNDWCEPFAWTKDADELLAKVRPSKSDGN
jgi:hypothetical protein